MFEEAVNDAICIFTESKIVTGRPLTPRAIALFVWCGEVPPLLGGSGEVEIGMTDLGGRIGERIRERRKSAGMLQEDLANLMQVQSETVGRWESGQHPPKYNRLPAIAQALGVSVLWLIATDAEAEALGVVEQLLALPEAVRGVFVRSIRAHAMSDEDVELAIRVSQAPPEIREQMQRIIDALDPPAEPSAN